MQSFIKDKTEELLTKIKKMSKNYFKCACVIDSGSIGDSYKFSEHAFRSNNKKNFSCLPHEQFNLNNEINNLIFQYMEEVFMGLFASYGNESFKYSNYYQVSINNIKTKLFFVKLPNLLCDEISQDVMNGEISSCFDAVETFLKYNDSDYDTYVIIMNDILSLNGSKYYNLKDNLYVVSYPEACELFLNGKDKKLYRYVNDVLLQINEMFEKNETDFYSIFVCFDYISSLSDDCNNFIEKKYELIQDKINNELSKGTIQNYNWLKVFITAEWLFSKFGRVSLFDNAYSAVGYFKAIEQLLFNSLLEKYDHNFLLSKMNVENLDKIMLGQMQRFVRDYVSTEELLKYPELKKYYDNLLKDWIKHTRNGFLHKHIIKDLEIVENIRRESIQLFILTLCIFNDTPYYSVKCSKCGKSFNYYDVHGYLDEDLTKAYLEMDKMNNKEVLCNECAGVCNETKANDDIPF